MVPLYQVYPRSEPDGCLFAESNGMKTNAVRILDELGIAYDLREYEVDPHDLIAETVAAKIGLPEHLGGSHLPAALRDKPNLAAFPQKPEAGYSLDLRPRMEDSKASLAKQCDVRDEYFHKPC